MSGSVPVMAPRPHLLHQRAGSKGLLVAHHGERDAVGSVDRARIAPRLVLAARQ
jgi:hypothetical protein